MSHSVLNDSQKVQRPSLFVPGTGPEDDIPVPSRPRRMSVAYDNFNFMFTKSLHKPKPEKLKGDSAHKELSGGKPSVAKGKDKPCPIIFTSEFHEIMYKFTESRTFTFFILFIILLNTVMLIAQTWTIVLVRAAWYFAAIDNVFLGVYIMEIVLKLYVWRLKFFSEGWNILDLTIVVFNTIDFSLPLILQNVGSFNGAAIFRLIRIFRAVKAIRALRVLRTIRFLANLQVIMATILQSIRSISTIVMLMSLFVYMFAVIGRGLYSDVDVPRFGTLPVAIFTLIQLLTLDDWFEIYIKISNEGRWHILLYLFLYIIVEYLIFLNLFVAVLVDNFQLTLKAANEAAKKKHKSLDDSDDEEEILAYPVDDEDSTESEFSDEAKERVPVQEYYPDLNEDDLQHISHYFQVLTSIEYTAMILENQQRVLDTMVDLCVETNDDH